MGSPTSDETDCNHSTQPLTFDLYTQSSGVVSRDLIWQHVWREARGQNRPKDRRGHHQDEHNVDQPARVQVKLVTAYLCQFTTVAAAWELSVVTGGWQQEVLPSSIWDAGAIRHKHACNAMGIKGSAFDQSADAGKRFGILTDKNKTI